MVTESGEERTRGDQQAVEEPEEEVEAEEPARLARARPPSRRFPS